MCWGRNDEGQLGLGDKTDRTVPTAITDFGTGRTVKSLALGGFHTCAILDDDSVKCWGRNSNGQLGVGDTNSRSSSTTVDHTAKSLHLGGYASCAVLDDDSVKCWGWNPQGQVGDGTTVDRYSPTYVRCGANQYVVSNTCSLCPEGTTNAGNDFAADGDTTCTSS